LDFLWGGKALNCFDDQKNELILICFFAGLTDAQRNDFNLMKTLAEVTKPKAGERIA